LRQTWLVPQAVPLATSVRATVQADAPVAHDVVPVSQPPFTLQAAPAVQATHDPPPLQTALVPHEVPAPTSATLTVQADVPVAHEVSPVSQRLPPGLHAALGVQALHTPLPLQNMSVPHDVPGLRFVTLPQTAAPVVHAIVPWVHADGLQVAPDVQAMQLPLPSQTSLVPHVMPAVTFVMGAEQLRAPLVHDVVPVWHAEMLHVLPVVQETHEPLLQTMLVPHDVPFMTFATLLVQADTPVAHDVVPVWQTETLQAVPVVHVVHWPLSQTMPLPHAVPLVTLLTLAVHADVPVAHEVSPVWQADGAHAVPDVHATHAPLSQTWLLPQAVPLATFVVVPPQVEPPVEHDVVAVWHALPAGWHAWPDVHAMQLPLPSHTWLDPHVVPAEAFDENAHVEVPVEHVVIPVWQTLLVGLHATPAVHATHAPLSQTWLLPQAVPLATFVAPVHIDEPLEQSVVPVWQTLPPGLQFAPVVHAPHVPLLQT
jgi:hypothetical protein